MKFKIFFHDEAPRIGCGWRTVYLKKGRRWLYITDVASGRRQRLPLRITGKAGTFDTLRILRPEPVQ